MFARIQRAGQGAALIAVIAVSVAPCSRLAAQGGMDHAAHHASATPTTPTLAGQDAYGAIAEIVRMLEADSTTDWAKVNLEALRQHLIDMNEVTLRSVVVQRPIEGGLQMDVTGEGRTQDAIRRMTTAHGEALASHGLVARSEPITGGSRFTVTAREPRDLRLVAKIRGLGFIGLMTLGEHHAPHHLGIARGASAGVHRGH